MNTEHKASYSPLRKTRDRSRASNNSGNEVRDSQNDYLAPRQIQGILTNNYARDGSQNRSSAMGVGYPLYTQQANRGTNQFQEDEVLSANSGPPGGISSIAPGQHTDVTGSGFENYGPSGTSYQYKREYRTGSSQNGFENDRPNQEQEVNLTNHNDYNNRYLQQRTQEQYAGSGAPTPVSPEGENFNPNTMQIQADPYAPSLVYDLLQGKNEWKNIQDIVKLTFKAVCDTVKSQGQAVRELERQVQTKSTIQELTSSLALKANISDVSRTIADLQAAMDQKQQGVEDVNRLLDDRVTRQDMHYMLSNKVSVEELTRVLQTKSNMHEVNMEFGQLNSKMDDMVKDFNKRVANCSLQKDLAFLQTIVDKKADQDFVTDSLGQKANKQSVANALHRKANRTDVEEMLQTKAEEGELRNLSAQIHNKADMTHIDDLIRSFDNKVDRQELEVIKQDISTKVHKHDFEMLSVQIGNQRVEQDQNIKNAEKDIDDFMETIQNEISNLKNTMISSLNKKADFSMLDRLNDLVSKKVDQEQLRASMIQNKQELVQQIDISRNDQNLERVTKDQKVQERLEKVELSGERALDEIYSYQEKLRQLQEERKRDIEETADFIKQVIDNQKLEFHRDLSALKTESERVKNELIDRCSVQELISTKQDLLQQIDAKVDLKEVQGALNDCQNDLAEQLTTFKQKINEKITTQEVNLTRVIERKVDHKDYKSLIDEKMDKAQSEAMFARAEDLERLEMKSDELQKQVETKLHRDQFIQLDQQIEEKLVDIFKQLSRKSNIKDVCALLDMKSNTDEVNKALDEIHEEMDKVVVTKSELSEALQEQSSINEALCAENCSARWLWKSGDLQNGFAVPWEIQTINTCPENFLWDEDKSMILTVAPGLYELNFGFFSTKHPTIQVLVNGEPILSAVNSSSYVIHHSAGKLKQTGKQHSQGNLTGLTMIDFIALPARARISLSYSGDKKCEGFLGLRKL